MEELNDIRDVPRRLNQTNEAKGLTPQVWGGFARRFRWTGCVLQTAQLVSEGLSNKEIAKRLKCGLDNVSKHLGQIYESLGVHGRSSVLPKLTGIYEQMTAAAKKLPPPHE